MLFSAIFAAATFGFTALARSIQVNTARAPEINATQAFEITSFKGTSPSGRDGDTYYLTLNIADLSSTPNASTSCPSSLNTSAEVPSSSDPLLCTDSTFSWYFAGYVGLGNFSVGIRHDANEGVSDFISQSSYPGQVGYQCASSGGCVASMSGAIEVAFE